MEPITKIAKIGKKENKENGEVTLFIENENGGPITTGVDLNDAKTKFKQAFGAHLVMSSFCSIKKALDNSTLGREGINTVVEECKKEISSINELIEHAV